MKENLFNKDLLDEKSDLPIYYRIMTYIRHQIQTGVLKPGDLLPPESKLCEIYGVSRTTIRLAFNQLVEENLITRHRGKGSYVSSPRLQRNLNHLYSFTQDMINMDLHPSSIIIECCIAKGSKDITDTLKLPKDSDLFKLVRVRCADNEPILLEATYIPYFICDKIHKEDFSVTSLYGILQYKYNLKLNRAIETYESVKLDKNTARLLECKPSTCAFNIHRIGFLENDMPYEYTYSFVRSDKCIFTVELMEGKKQAYFSRKIIP